MAVPVGQDDVRLDQGTGCRLDAPGFLPGIANQPEFSGCACCGEYPRDVANEARTQGHCSVVASASNSLTRGSRSAKMTSAVFKPLRRPLSRSPAESLLQIVQASAARSVSCR